MTDYFALLDEPRRPWLDPEALKEKFFKLSSRLHPDRIHGAGVAEKAEAQRQFTELNSAYHCLEDPRQRLRHLLELETGTPAPRVDQVPSTLMEASLEISSLCRETDLFLKQKAAATSPLLQVETFRQAQEWIERLSALRSRIAARRDQLLRQLAALDGRWLENQRAGAAQPAELLRELAELYRVLGYVHRWAGQVQERIVQLAL